MHRFKNVYNECIKLNFHCLGATGLESAGFAKELPNEKTGHPLATGEEIDQQIRHYLTDLRKRGCIMNTSVAIAVGEGILLMPQTIPDGDWYCPDWRVNYYLR